MASPVRRGEKSSRKKEQREQSPGAGGSTSVLGSLESGGEGQTGSVIQAGAGQVTQGLAARVGLLVFLLRPRGSYCRVLRERMPCKAYDL